MKRKKRAVTLIEIMIVILLIGLISGALAINMRGSLDQGRVFKTRQHMARVYDVLMLEYAKGEKTLKQIVEERKKLVNNSPLAKDGEALLCDGWGDKFTVKVKSDDPDDIEITSKKLTAWEAKQK